MGKGNMSIVYFAEPETVHNCLQGVESPIKKNNNIGWRLILLFGTQKDGGWHCPFDAAIVHSMSDGVHMMRQFGWQTLLGSEKQRPNIFLSSCSLRNDFNQFIQQVT